jgi:hypothetical protein
LDFFQINLKERILIWSLDENALVMDLKNYQKLISPERFVDCGFTLFKTVTKRNNKGQNSTKIQELLQTRDHSSVCMKYNDLAKETGCFFRTFTRTGIREILKLRSLECDEEQELIAA